jgi:para-nitrobenzyl esterase
VVGINHRLNIFGYLYLAQLGGAKYADSGNVGTLDAVLALQWVRDNIANFGGDPGNVTIFGQSGGGAKVSTLMAMPLANGLFHKVIVESASPVLRAIPAEAATASAQKFLDHLGLKPNQADQLQQMSMEKLLNAMHEITAKEGLSLGPVVDGRSLPRHPFDPTAPEISASVPMMIGTTATETTLMIGGYDPATFSLDEISLRARLKTLFKAGDAEIENLIAAYRKDQVLRLALFSLRRPLTARYAWTQSRKQNASWTNVPHRCTSICSNGKRRSWAGGCAHPISLRSISPMTTSPKHRPYWGLAQLCSGWQTR